jgi:hypothetical protein
MQLMTNTFIKNNINMHYMNAVIILNWGAVYIFVKFFHRLNKY